MEPSDCASRAGKRRKGQRREAGGRQKMVAGLGGWEDY